MKFNKLLFTVMGAFVFCFVIVLVYISLLGENNRVDASVQRFFDEIKSKAYFSICNNTIIMGTDDPFKQGGDCAENCFLFELSLLKYFKLDNSDNYKVIVKKDHFWIPYSGDNYIKASLCLMNLKDYSPFSFFGKKPDTLWIEDLFTMHRQNGVWKIVGIDLQNKAIFPIFEQLKKDLELGTYITRTGNKYIIRQMEIDTDHLDTIEKRKIEYILLKISRLIMDKNASN